MQPGGGGRPSVGKTGFALGMAARAAMRANKPVLVFSLEMNQLGTGPKAKRRPPGCRPGSQRPPSAAGRRVA